MRLPSGKELERYKNFKKFDSLIKEHNGNSDGEPAFELALNKYAVLVRRSIK